ncbi:MAG: hypothetical protein L6R42_002129 [Xanthoria sp. 1 TBL-2021]|nr:MAG: hypothetical protein L6R42_002129 [Xanthoria sp. 1 TBL-2021]
MATCTIYTRVYSNSSAGKLVSAKGPKGDPLSHKVLRREFKNQANKWNRKPTALVSASDRIVDTVQRAFDKYYEDGDSPGEIWIAFIEIPRIVGETTARIHSAKALAAECGFPRPGLYSHEIVFEWVIPEECVIHQVSLQTLMDRGIWDDCFLRRSTAEVRRSLAERFHGCNPWEIGIDLGGFARTFGARAPVDWIAYQLFHDCVYANILDDDVVKLHCAHGDVGIVDFQFFCDLEDGIDTCLYEWWLADIDFFQDHADFDEWRAGMEDAMIWDLIDLWESWRVVDCDETSNEPATGEEILYADVKKRVLIEHEKKRATIEAEALKIGL